MLEITGLATHGYEIGEKIGEGGYGIVYRAYQPSVQRDVAVKIILPELAAVSEFARRFDEEAHLVAKLEHPRIVPLYDYWRDENGAFLVMRYIKGGNLREMMSRQGPLSLVHIIRLFQQIAEALAFAHSAGIVHRDLKPDNILLDDLGNAYLGDFGIAKSILDSSRISTSNAIVGTPAYLSPEQIEGQPITPRTDIYSLGILLYEMLTGEHPFKDDRHSLFMKHLLEPLPNLREKRPNLTDIMDDVVQKATAKDPQKRYGDVSAFFDDFRAASNLSRSTPLAVFPEVRHPTPHKTPATLEGRNRYNMLENVRTFWIEGVLENSLKGSKLINLNLKERGGVVKSPWDTLLPNVAKSDATLPPDISILDLYDRFKGKMLILGEPGAGKTTTLLELARDLLYRAEEDDHHPIPVVLNLASWAETSKPLNEWIVDELGSKYQAPRLVAKEWVDSDSLLLLLDGLDELAASNRESCVTAINNYREDHGFVDIIVSGRTHEYEALPNKLRLNGAIILQPLTDAQIDTYLSGYGANVATVRTMLAEDTVLRQMSKSPLMLNIIVLAYRDISSEDLPHLDTLEARRNHLFGVYIQRMFGRYSGVKPYTDEQTNRYLAWLARKINEQKQSVFLIEKMQPTWLMALQQNRYYQNLMLSNIVAYGLVWAVPGVLFTAQIYNVNPLLYGLLHLFAGGLWGWTLASRTWKWRWNAILVGSVFGLCKFLSFAVDSRVQAGLSEGIRILILYVVGYAVFRYLALRRGQNRDNIITVERLRFSKEAVRPWMALIGALMAFLVTLTVPGIALVSRIVSILIGIVLTIFLSGLTSDQVERSVTPNQGIRRTAVNGLWIGLIAIVLIYLLVGLPAAFSESPSLALMRASYNAFSAFGLTSLFFGLQSALQHFLVRRILQGDGEIPANYAHFLDYAVSLIFLHKVGGGYIFVHRNLQDYFASQEN